MEKKGFPAQVKQIEGRTVSGIASVFGVLDSYDDIVHLGAFKKTLKERRQHLRHLWQHDFDSPPIATIKDIRELKADELPKDMQKLAGITGGLLVERDYLNTERANEVLEGIRNGAISEMSFAFDPLKFDFEEMDMDGRSVMVRNIREVRLYETSDVNWGANPFTQASSKSIVPYSDTGYVKALDAVWQVPTLADFTDRDWDELSDAHKDRIAAHFAYRGVEDSFEALKLPHHMPSKDGVGKVVWAGVKAAMGSLLDVAPKSRKDVYSHIIKHYASFGKEPPSLEWFDLAGVLDGIGEASGMIGSADFHLLKQLNDKIKLALKRAEPGSPLTSEIERKILQSKIELAKLVGSTYENQRRSGR